MNKFQNNFKLIILTVSFFIFAISVVSAQTKSDIKFPIPELGNCKSESDCKSYCDKPDNIISCVSFGEKNGLVSAEEASRAREFVDVLKGEGPGGCKDKEGCESYCNDINNVDECLTFAEKHNLIPDSELKEAKKVQKVLKEGGKLPGGCSNKKSCDDFCSEPKNVEECFAFAEKAGFIPPEELEQARKAIPLIARGQSPGGCKNKEECQSYCEKGENATECINFAEKVGFVSKEEADIVRKTGGKGPGDCRSKEACEAYCNNPENQENCFKFAEKHGLIPEEKIKEMKEGMMRLKEGLKQMRQGLEQMPPEMRTCVEDKIGAEKIAAIEAGEEIEIGPEFGDIMRECGERMVQKMGGAFDDVFNQVPVEVRDCIKEHVGENTNEDWSSERNQSRIREFVTDCMKKLNVSSLIPEGAIPPADYAPAGIEGNMTPPTGMTPPPEMMSEICEKFSLAPSCDYIPAEFRDLCLKCKQ